MVEIPIEDATPDFTESVNVGDVSLSMRFTWNNRDQHWFADFESVDGKNNGIRLVVDTPLLAYRNRCLKGGDIVVLQTTTDQIKKLGFDNFGKDFSLFYMSSEEVSKYIDAVASMEPTEAT